MMKYLIVAELTVLVSTLLPPWNSWHVYRSEFFSPAVPWVVLLTAGLLWPLWLAACIVAAISGAIYGVKKELRGP